MRGVRFQFGASLWDAATRQTVTNRTFSRFNSARACGGAATTPPDSGALARGDGGLCANLRPMIISDTPQLTFRGRDVPGRDQCRSCAPTVLPEGVDRVGAVFGGTVELSICEQCGIRIITGSCAGIESQRGSPSVMDAGRT